MPAKLEAIDILLIVTSKKFEIDTIRLRKLAGIDLRRIPSTRFDNVAAVCGIH